VKEEKSTKDLILENVRKLQERISSLEEELESWKEKGVLIENPCWWDAKPCPLYTKISGLQEAGNRCSTCRRVDRETLDSVLDGIASESFREKMQELAEEVDEAKKEGQEKLEDILKEIHDEISQILIGEEIKPSE